MKPAASFVFEKKLWQNGFKIIAGLDEVGRGSWAGPVVAAAVIFPQNLNLKIKLFDSKLLNSKQRIRLDRIIRKVAVDIGIGLIDVEIIDKIGIGKAAQMAFRAALKDLKVKADYFLIDTFYIKYLKKEKQLPIKKGDSLCASIAAASIVAKVYRDKLMKILAKRFKKYSFGRHKGYGTKKHQEEITQFGFSQYHRRSFNLKFLSTYG